ncbi:putative ribonuclease h protein [Quercus suber]|uniref:Ribonuclease h protein n=1 Tax=Quercus suber TaxID=58331 RepID=A0AAW0KUC8_QUESU
MKVMENGASNEWDIDKLGQWFLLDDKDAILGIPLSSTSTSDRLVWAENKSGKFTVKSAYTLVLDEQKGSGLGHCSNGMARRKLWKAIWKLHLLQKIKLFAWKAGRDILASKENLAKRKITPDGVCEFCGDAVETIGHTLWFCDHAKEVWRNSKFALPFEISATWKFLDVLKALLRCEHLRPRLLELFIATCWGIWKNRNELRAGGKGKAGRSILRNASLLVEEYRMFKI